MNESMLNTLGKEKEKCVLGLLHLHWDCNSKSELDFSVIACIKCCLYDLKNSEHRNIEVNK